VVPLPGGGSAPVHANTVSRLPNNTWGNSRWGVRLTGVVNRDYTVQSFFYRTFNQAPSDTLLTPGGPERATNQALNPNGPGANVEDENDGKSFGGRLVWEGIPNLAIGANVAAHDYENTIDPARDFAGGYALDAEWGTFSAGWHAQAGVVTGDNWKNLDAMGAPSTFRSAQAILAYKHLVSVTGLEAVEPVARLSWADPDAALADDHDLFATLGFVTHFAGRNKMAFNVERWMPAIGEGEWSVKVQTYLHF